MSGSRGYRFGDGTRWLLGKVGDGVKAVTGKEEYHFGDLTKAIAATVGAALGATALGLGTVYRDYMAVHGAEEEFLPLTPRGATGRDAVAGGGGDGDAIAAVSGVPDTAKRPAMGGISGDDTTTTTVGRGGGRGGMGTAGGAGEAPVGTGEVVEEPVVALEAGEVSMGDLWGSFFASSLVAGEQAVSSGVLPADDVECREGHVYLGLPGLTLLEAVLRSLVVDQPGIVLARRVLVRTEMCPKEVLPMFQELVEVRDELKRLGVAKTSDDADFLRQTVLFAGADREITSELAEERRMELRRQAARVQGVATAVTQLSFYKQNFEQVLMDLDERI